MPASTAFETIGRRQSFGETTWQVIHEPSHGYSVRVTKPGRTTWFACTDAVDATYTLGYMVARAHADSEK